MDQAYALKHSYKKLLYCLSLVSAEVSFYGLIGKSPLLYSELFKMYTLKGALEHHYVMLFFHK